MPSLGLFLKALRDRLPTAKRQRKRAREEEEERGPHPWLLFGGKHIVLLSLALLPFPSRSSSRRSTFLRELLRVRDGGGGGGGGGGDCCLTHNALSSLLHRCLLSPSSGASTVAKERSGRGGGVRATLGTAEEKNFACMGRAGRATAAANGGGSRGRRWQQGGGRRRRQGSLGFFLAQPFFLSRKEEG